ncbi:MAG TPA: hypothetical protein VFO17_06140 [Acidimicrobiia bacterium]|jgi:hypothetical protein|nr:hypothetical protein [Acidimicrobiia bacterium]
MSKWLRLVAIVALIFGGCSSDVSGDSFDLSEFAIAGPSTIPAGSQSLDVTNSGEFPHTLVVTDSSGQVVAATDLVAPDENARLEVDLAAGVYSFTCRIVAQDSEGALIDHFESGMHASVRVED